MSVWQILLGIFLFMIATMVIYGWGLVRQKNLGKDLTNQLFDKGNRKVLDYLKKNPHITEGEVEKLCSGITAKLPFSGSKAVVAKPKEYARELLGYMVKTGQLEKTGALYKRAERKKHAGK